MTLAQAGQAAQYRAGLLLQSQLSRVESQADTASSDDDEAYKIFLLLCDVACEPAARATVTKSSQDFIRSEVRLMITRWLCLAFSGLCGDGGQWLDLATFPSPAEYKELGARRERERDTRARARRRETGDEMLIWSRTRGLSTVSTPACRLCRGPRTPDALFDITMSLLRKSQLLIIKNLWLLHMLKNIFRTFWRFYHHCMHFMNLQCQAIALNQYFNEVRVIGSVCRCLMMGEKLRRSGEWRQWCRVLAADILKDWSWSGLGCGWLRDQGLAWAAWRAAVWQAINRSVWPAC